MCRGRVVRPSAQLSCRRGRSGFCLRGRDIFGTVVAQKLLDCLGRDRSGIQLSLSQFAANIFEHVRLRLCFYAFAATTSGGDRGRANDNDQRFREFRVRVHARDERPGRS